LGFDHLEAGELEIFRVHFAGVRVIVNEQHARPLGFAFGVVVRLGAHLRPFTGSIRLNVEPLLSSLCTVIRPSSIWARRRQIERPRPVPPYGRVGVLSSWRKSSKIFS